MNSDIDEESEDDILEKELVDSSDEDRCPCWEKVEYVDWTLNVVDELISLVRVDEIDSRLEETLGCCELKEITGLKEM